MRHVVHLRACGCVRSACGRSGQPGGAGLARSAGGAAQLWLGFIGQHSAALRRGNVGTRGGAADCTWRRCMCVGCVHRHGVVKLVALVVRERLVVRRSGPLGSRPLVLGVRVHGLRHRRGLGV